MINFIMVLLWAASLWGLGHIHRLHLGDLRLEISRQRTRAEVAECQLNGVIEAWADQLQQNRYRVSEVERAMRKAQVGGKTEPN